ncbi:AAA domain-containing protein [Marinobacter sp. F4216]|uniref:AAA domain-containing protein n=1 Tax=Marinobacter sp. F4216 TaxID=2874281 RepID=UPI001CC02B90|nr:AAA domain-containing protein [Marinobacter sp. F4216]MBZ2170265.1 DnaJ domain-containing protein [Marinobacter sp. F4216]
MSEKDIEFSRKILERWQAIEFFTPFTLPAPQKLNKKKEWCEYLKWNDIKSDPNKLPWMAGESKTVGTEYFYYVHLGVFSMSAATRVLSEHLPATEDAQDKMVYEERNADPEYTCFAQIKVEADGTSDLSQISISTLPWALGKLRAGSLQKLTYSNLCDDNETLAMELSGGDSEAESSQHVSVESLETLLRTLIKWAGFQPDPALDRVFAVCIDAKPQKTKKAKESKSALSKKDEPDSSKQSKELVLRKEREVVESLDEGVAVNSASSSAEAIEPSLPILNSFFAEDLERAIEALENNSASKALQQYLSNVPPKHEPDLYSAEGLRLINELVHYRRNPLGRWFNEPEHGMALMQQFAVNVAFRDLVEGKTLDEQGGIISVNGPPGTGKTTLLGDVVASNIVRRAVAISEFASAKNTISSDGSVHRDLTGFEMIVASSNNTAVENISTEIPLAKKLGKEFRSLDYLKPVATMLQADLADGKELALPDEEDRNWGLIAAVMGKKGNINAFKDRFFFSKHESREEESGRLLAGSFWKWREAYRKIAPSFTEAKAEFKDALKNYQEQLDSLDAFCANNKRLIELDQQEKELLAKRASAEVKVKELEVELDALNQNLSSLKSETWSVERDRQFAEDRINQLQWEHPFWAPLQRFFNTRTWRAYEYQVNAAQIDLDRLKHRLVELSQRTREACERERACARQLLQWQKRFVDELGAVEDEREALRAQVRAFVDDHPQMRLPGVKDQVEGETVQRKAPWQDAKINAARSDLLKQALQLHAVWLIEVLKRKEARDRLFELSQKLGNGDAVTLKDWQLLFMIVPVMSTTFASLGRMLQSVPSSSLGWLMIDEAGQAPPQQAIGGLLRARNVLVVGDPLQVEPVVTAPTKLLEKIMGHDIEPGVETDWNPGKQSVQTLADRVNPYHCMMEGGQAPTRVGIPLWVHRRCVDPMFSVANEIAYDNRMVHGNESHEPATDPVFDNATWFDSTNVSRPEFAGARDKQFRPEDAVILVNVLSHLLASGTSLDDVFVITPFKAISNGLKAHVRKNQNVLTNAALLARSGDVDEIPVPDVFSWANGYIGTIHTFQGRENSTVIMVLGCDENRKGAINWASSSPNILNVAVTRAKKHLYVIGPLKLWEKQAGFSVLRRHLSVAEDPGMPVQKKSEMPLSERQKLCAALDVESDASVEEIKAGFRKKAQKHHPDKFSSDEYSNLEREQAIEAFEQAKEAYEKLMSDAKDEQTVA